MMPRRFLILFIAAMMCLLSACRSSDRLLTTRPDSSADQAAADTAPTIPREKLPDRKTRLHDDARILTEVQNTTASTMMDYLSNKREIDITAAIIDSTGGAEALNYAHFLYDRRNYGYSGTKDGMLLLIAHKDRQAAIATSGKCRRLYSDKVVSYMLSEITPLLTDADFAGALRRYTELADELYHNKASVEIIE